MTIKVERETLVALQSQPWPSSSDDIDDLRIYSKYPAHHDHYLSSSPVDIRKESLPCSISLDDDDSVYTISTASCSDSESDIDRRVCFADDLVSDVWTRPYTEKEDASELYYSNDETQRFRQEYRHERKVLSSLLNASEFSVDGVDEEDLSSLLLSKSTPPSLRHRNGISRVVVLHNDRLETFGGPSSTAEVKSPSSTSSLLSSSPSSSIDDVGSSSTASDDINVFFDTPEFWSGSITWW